MPECDGADRDTQEQQPEVEGAAPGLGLRLLKILRCDDGGHVTIVDGLPITRAADLVLVVNRGEVCRIDPIGLASIRFGVERLRRFGRRRRASYPHRVGGPGSVRIVGGEPLRRSR